MFNYSNVIGVLNTNFAKFVEEKLMFDCLVRRPY